MPHLDPPLRGAGPLPAPVAPRRAGRSRGRAALLLVLLGLSGCASSKKPVPPELAATALAAVLEAASQVAAPATLDTFRRYGIAVRPDASPERAALVEAVRRWPEERKQAALAWVQANATWTTLLHALALESFGPGFEPRAWGPSMSRFDPATFERRAGLAPLLRAAAGDEAVAALAARLQRPPPAFTAAGLAERRRRLVGYLRLPDELPRFAALYDPFLAPSHGVNVELPDGTILFVVGPTAEPRDAEMVLVHEMAHQPVARVLRSLPVLAALDASRCAFDGIRERYGYETWPSFFAEALVRSLSYRLADVAPRDTGFVFEARLVAALEAWEREEGGAFDAAVSRMLADIRAERCPTAAP